MTAKALLIGLATLILIIGLVAFSAPSVSGQEAAPLTITIHAAECPAGYQGNDPFGDCHENRIGGVSFEWNAVAPGAPRTVSTDGNGVAVIETSAGAGGLGLYITEQPPFDLAGYSVYCSTGGGSATAPLTYIDDEVGIRFMADTLGSGGEVVCDWYNIPVAIPAGGGDGDENAGDEPVTQLPDTGVGNLTIVGERSLLPATAAALALGGLALELRRRTLH
jgi:hypothetical protein